MTKTTRILVLAAALTLLLALVSTANAEPGKCHKNDPDCSAPEPLGVGLSCADWFTLGYARPVIPLTWDADENGTFPDPLALTSGDNATCIDVSTTTAGSFTVEVTSVTPTAKRNSILAALVKDSHPGDHCGWIGEDDPRSALNLNLTNVDKETGTIEGTIFGVPAAIPDACGTDYADTSDPLAFMLFITGKRGITANITLTYEADALS